MADANPTQTNNGSFHLFPYLADELKMSVLSFITTAPFETLPENYRKSSLTHSLPHVSRKFRELSMADMYWKKALERQVCGEAVLWRTALYTIICGQETHPVATSSCNTSAVLELCSAPELVQRTQQTVKQPFKQIYKDVVSNHLRFKGPVFMMNGQVQLGQAYTLHFFEPRYRRLISTVMKDQSAEACSGGRIQGAPMFLHANRNPLAPKTPACLVQVVRCEISPDGRAVVAVMPCHYVWIEKVWMGRNTGRLFFAQSLRMTAVATHQMHCLVRSEQMTNVMGLMAGGFNTTTNQDEYLENTHQAPAAAVSDDVIQAALEEDFEDFDMDSEDDDESWENDDSEFDSDASSLDESSEEEDDNRYYESGSDTGTYQL